MMEMQITLLMLYRKLDFEVKEGYEAIPSNEGVLASLVWGGGRWDRLSVLGARLASSSPLRPFRPLGPCSVFSTLLVLTPHFPSCFAGITSEPIGGVPIKVSVRQ